MVDVFSERWRKLRPRNSGRRRPSGWHGNTAQTNLLLDRHEGIPRPGNGPGMMVKISDQGCVADLGDEAIDRAVVNRLWLDPASRS